VRQGGAEMNNATMSVFSRIAIIISCLAGSCVCANAQQSHIVAGLGNNSCGHLLDYKNRGDSDASAMIIYLADQSWIDGFLTGVSFFRPSVDSSLSRTDSHGVRAWIARYCAAHPLNTLFDAALFLSDTLYKK